jgi:hypothetical protein
MVKAVFCDTFHGRNTGFLMMSLIITLGFSTEARKRLGHRSTGHTVETWKEFEKIIKEKGRSKMGGNTGSEILDRT